MPDTAQAANALALTSSDQQHVDMSAPVILSIYSYYTTEALQLIILMVKLGLNVTTGIRFSIQNWIIVRLVIIDWVIARVSFIARITNLQVLLAECRMATRILSKIASLCDEYSPEVSVTEVNEFRLVVLAGYFTRKKI